MTYLSPDDLATLKTVLKRDPTPVESSVVSVMWSEHCSYKSTRRLLKQFPAKGDGVVVGIGEDAGIITFATHDNQHYGIAVSHESHNHPSQLLPVEGAATGVGGVVRDVYCMGATVVGVLNSLHFSPDPDSDYIQTGVVQGIGDYANALGVPVLGGETLYHPSYTGNCLVNVAALGLVNLDNIIHSYVPAVAATVDYSLILIGKSTDSTGFGGATFSSELLDDSQDNIGAVQVHDPFLKRVIIDVLDKIWAYANQHNIAIGCKDLGAGGIACATSEITSAAGFGARINLNDVNTVTPDLDPAVIACSETQERFCLAVPTEHAKAIINIANHDFAMGDLYPNAGGVIIGTVTQTTDYSVTHDNTIVCDLPISIITTDVQVDRVSIPRTLNDPQLPYDTPDRAAITQTINTLKKTAVTTNSIYKRFDHGVRGDTIIYPGEADAGVIAPIPHCTTGLAVSIDSNTYGTDDPYESGLAAVAESVRNITAVGATPLALTDCLNYGNPENPAVFFDIEQGIHAISTAAQAYNLPVISGNVSLYNESKQSICPSPVILCIGRIADFRQSITMAFKATNTVLVWIGSPRDNTDLAIEIKQNAVCLAIQATYTVYACHDISHGGLAVTLLEMIRHTPTPIGCHITGLDDLDLAHALFSEFGGFVLEVNAADSQAIVQLGEASGVAVRTLGNTVASPELMITWRHETTHH